MCQVSVSAEGVASIALWANCVDIKWKIFRPQFAKRTDIDADTEMMFAVPLVLHFNWNRAVHAGSIR